VPGTFLTRRRSRSGVLPARRHGRLLLVVGRVRLQFPAADAKAREAGRVYETVSFPDMPASSWPGTEQ
jgi:hypothetical protein